MSDVEMPDFDQLYELMNKRQFDEWMRVAIRGILTLAGGREMERQLVNLPQPSRPGVPAVKVSANQLANQAAVAILEDPKNAAMVHVYQNDKCRELQAIFLGPALSDFDDRMQWCQYVKEVVEEALSYGHELTECSLTLFRSLYELPEYRELIRPTLAKVDDEIAAQKRILAKLAPSHRATSDKASTVLTPATIQGSAAASTSSKSMTSWAESKMALAMEGSQLDSVFLSQAEYTKAVKMLLNVLGPKGDEKEETKTTPSTTSTGTAPSTL